MNEDTRPYPNGLAWDEAWLQRQRADLAEEILNPNRLKVVICEYLLSVNKEMKGPFISPTAIDWLGNGIVKAILKDWNPN